MLKIENVVLPSSDQWAAVIRGARNPMNSWEKSDSGYCMDTIACHTCMCNRNLCKKNIDSHAYVVGINDYNLMKKLAKAGTDHRKFMRFIDVYLDIEAPLYWWKEFDTYRAGVTPGDYSPNPFDIDENSCSTMHKIAAKEFVPEDFSHEHLLNPYGINGYQTYMVALLNYYRDIYLNGGTLSFENEDGDIVDREYKPKDKDIWWQMIQLLPSSYNQRRTIKLNYEVLANIYKSRRNHKLDEWHVVCDWIETLPYSELITGKNKKNELEEFIKSAKSIDPHIDSIEKDKDDQSMHNLLDRQNCVLYGFDFSRVSYSEALSFIENVQGRKECR